MRGRRRRWTRWSLLVLAVVTMTGAPPAAAQEPPKLERAIRLYDKGELDRATKLLREVVRELRIARAARARAWLYLGLAEASPGRADLAAARRAFANALREDPGVAVDKERVPPHVVRLFEEEQHRLTGVLDIVASEKGGRVFVDGVKRGGAPRRVRVLSGAHRVRVVSRDGRRDFRAALVTATAGASTRVVARLSPITGRVRLKLEPSDTEVLRGKERVAVGPAAQIDLSPGTHRLTLRRQGYREETRTVIVKRGKLVELTVALRSIGRPWYQRRRVWGYVSGGLAAALALTGGLLGQSAKSAEDEIRSRERNLTLAYDQWLALSDRASSRARWANVLFGLAGAAAVTSVVLILTGGGKSDSPLPRQAAWRLSPLPAGAALAVDF